MATSRITQAKQVGRVPSMSVALNPELQKRFEALEEEAVMVDIHQHPFVLTEDMGQLIEYLRTNSYGWGYEAVKHGGCTTVTTANVFKALVNSPDMSFVEYDDVLAEVSLMLADMRLQRDVVKIGNANDIVAAKQQGKLGFQVALARLHTRVLYNVERLGQRIVANIQPHLIRTRHRQRLNSCALGGFVSGHLSPVRITHVPVEPIHPRLCRNRRFL